MLRLDFCPTCRQGGGNASQLHRPLQIQELGVTLRMTQGKPKHSARQSNSFVMFWYQSETDLAGADLSVNVRLLADSVLQV